MEEAVSDAIVTQNTNDLVLARLIDIAYAEIEDNRPVFPNPLHEPCLYRKLRSWVATALEEQKAIQKHIDK